MRSSCGFFFVTRCFCYCCCCCWCWIKHKKVSKNSTISLTHYLSCLGKEKKFHQKDLKVTFELQNGLYVYYLSFDTSARFISHSALSRHWSCSDFDQSLYVNLYLLQVLLKPWFEKLFMWRWSLVLNFVKSFELSEVIIKVKFALRVDDEKCWSEDKRLF